MRHFGSKIGNIGHSIGSVDKSMNISKKATGVANEIISNEVGRIIVPKQQVMKTKLLVSRNISKSTMNTSNNKSYSNKLKSQPQQPQLQQEEVNTRWKQKEVFYKQNKIKKIIY